ncbi:hypothetical protein ABZ760_12010 [Streptomyces sp. NPDC006658]
MAPRGREHEGARTLLAAVEPRPFHKAGQFLLDLVEGDDLMVDGDPSP